MKKQVLFIHSAGPQRLQEGNTGLQAYLKEALGKEFYFSAPKMPEPEDPEYSRWKDRLDKEFAAMNDEEVILIGHSLGGSVLLKYLSEETAFPPVTGLFIVASPFWGKDTGWDSEVFLLMENSTSLLPEIADFLFSAAGTTL